MLVLVLLDDVLFFDDLAAGLLDVRRPIGTNIHVGRLVDGLLAAHSPLLDDFMLFHYCLLRLLTGRVQKGCQLEHAAQGEREQRRRRDHRHDGRTYEGEAETEPRGGPPDRQSARDGMGGGGDRDEPRRAEDP